jgi:uncharacterized membrane protein YhhN
MRSIKVLPVGLVIFEATQETLVRVIRMQILAGLALTSSADWLMSADSQLEWSKLR